MCGRFLGGGVGGDGDAGGACSPGFSGSAVHNNRVVIPFLPPLQSHMLLLLAEPRKAMSSSILFGASTSLPICAGFGLLDPPCCRTWLGAVGGSSRILLLALYAVSLWILSSLDWTR